MKTIFILDQDKLYAQSLGRYLSNHGYVVDILYDAQEAIVKIDQSKPDMILCELLLANNNGLEFVYELRSYSEWQDIKLVILSRVSQDDINMSEKNMSDFDVADFWYKPEISIQNILEKIEKILDIKTLTEFGNGQN